MQGSLLLTACQASSGPLGDDICRNGVGHVAITRGGKGLVAVQAILAMAEIVDWGRHTHTTPRGYLVIGEDSFPSASQSTP
ncbi:hypothetical protein Cob_v000022 [Colletotrichum orbiculare MAFF 240422]|uniref:Uncharacterized protein n=1 Tax=Colletotrichum orbiculare (strain 104-T / ATCC 96160 / CBS 514.97 / LARS 414 / MAFF 240422) TaxID=1213857 RepID=A0A484G6K9_COLOR|nr:hypothetical protein Cob_v000022 [Colletotrichum orbiculare MAFF 240422]